MNQMELPCWTVGYDTVTGCSIPTIDLECQGGAGATSTEYFVLRKFEELHLFNQSTHIRALLANTGTGSIDEYKLQAVDI